jgi:signal transduction histidine kinase
VEAIVVLAQDVTMLRSELRGHQLAEAALAAADRQKDVFFATVLHELRQPLAPLRFGLELLKRSPSPSSAERALATMERQLSQLERLLMDLTELAREGRSALALRLRPIDVVQIVREVVHEAEPLVRERRHELSSQLPGPYLVAGDPGRLRQIFSNLLVNAAKYTDPGGRIRVFARVEEAEIVIVIADNGQGIDASALPHIFELFVQEQVHGTGMGVGLHVVQQLVTTHGGRVHAYSAGKGHGSEFVVRLPRLVTSDLESASSIPQPLSD